MSDPKSDWDILPQEILEENAGMSPYEASVYLALIRGGKQSMSELSDASEVPRQRIYDIVKRLRERGFVEIIDEYPKQAYPVDPEKALSPIQDRIRRTRNFLEDLHQAVDEVEEGVSLFKSEASIRKYIRRIITTADMDLFLTIPHHALDMFREDLSELPSDVRTKLIISEIDPEISDGDSIVLDNDVTELADEVRGVTSSEPFIVCADRKTGFYWPELISTQPTQEQGFYITNPELGLLLDRFLSDLLWPIAQPVNPSQNTSELPTFPAQYIRVRDCLADLKQVTADRALESFEIEFEGYDTDTGEAVTKRGILSGYYFSEFDVRASFTLDTVDEPATNERESVSVGGWKAIQEDYEAVRLTVYEREHRELYSLDTETRNYVKACREELPNSFGDRHAVIGIDTTVDRMREIVVEQLEPGKYRPMEEYASFRESIIEFEAEDSPPGMMWAQTETTPGGITGHMGEVFNQLDYSLAFVGNFGKPIHPVFKTAYQGQTIFSIGSPTYADYVQFDDGKFILADLPPTNIDWETIRNTLSLDRIAEQVDGAEFIALGTWGHFNSLPTIWDGIRMDLWPRLEDPPEKALVLPGDIQDVPDSEIENGLESIRNLSDILDVTIVTNRTQADSFSNEIDGGEAAMSLSDMATILQDAMEVSKFVVHAPLEAALGNGEEVLTACAPRPRSVQITNVDDHFNTGLALGMTEGLTDEASLVLAHAVAGVFMREREPPTEKQIRSFVAEYDRLFDSQKDTK
ncbi:TrmB family transcriptional regulator [Halorhabdus tiamatea]|nr:TrmB family transcriptional regulator sugar-binding domain-containing protein [Halorhabdus tiamatea]